MSCYFWHCHTAFTGHKIGRKTNLHRGSIVINYVDQGEIQCAYSKLMPKFLYPVVLTL